MAKKNSAGILYVIGTALIVIGFCCPMFSGLFGSSANGFRFIDFNKVTFVDIGAILLFCGAVIGLVWSCLGLLGIKMPSSSLIKLIAVIASVVGAVVLIIGFTQDSLYKAIAKGFIKHALVGFYLICAGLVISIISLITNK